MILRKLSIINFKNIESAILEFTPGINCFVGDNGTGKTNVVDAIYYLSMCKSALVMTDSQSVRHSEDFFMLEGGYTTCGERSENVVCAFKKSGGKTLKRNGKEYEKLSDHIGLVPIAIISPTDTFLVSDAADERRKYLNGFLSQLEREYLHALIKYNHILGERNKMLKSHAPADPAVMDIYDMQLVAAGEVIHRHRTALIEKLSPHVNKYYSILSDDRETVELSYKSELNATPFADLLVAAREKDRVNQYSTCGVHRDDMVMKIGGYPLKKYGSQGQQKSFLIALKLAQYTLVAEEKNEQPILLLDDLFDKLDMQRVEKLLELISQDPFGQIFITDCNKVRLENILEKKSHAYALFNVESGQISRQ